MQFLNDVWVNWFEGEENGYNVCEFHEWRKEDFIEVLDQVPIVKVLPSFFIYVKDGLYELPPRLLNDVYKKAYLRNNRKRIQLDYCFIMTDGKNSLAVNTVGYEIPIRKSHLIPRQEQATLELAKRMKAKHYEINPLNKKEHHILSPSPHCMLGLTRKERQLKQLLFMALDHLKSTGTVAEVRYWLTEWQPESYIEYQLMDFEEAWTSLYAAVAHSWSEKHYTLCEKLIKGHHFFEKLWELEEGTQVN